MKEYDDEFEMLLGEIPHATSSLNLHPYHHHLTNLVDHGYVHASCVSHNIHGHGMYDDGLLRHKYASSPSPVSGFSLQSNGSSSSLLSGDGFSLSEFELLNAHLVPGNGFWLDCKKDSHSNLVDDFNLPRNFSNMYISDEQFECVNRSPNGAALLNLERFGPSDNYRKGFSDSEGFINLSVPRGNVNFDPAVMEMQHDPRIGNLSGSRYLPSRAERMFPRSEFGNPALSPQFYRANNVNSNFPMGFVVPEVPSNLNRPPVEDNFSYASRNGMNLVEARNAFYMPNAVQMANLMPHYNDESLRQYTRSVPNGRNKDINAFTREDSLIIQGEGVKYGLNRGNARLRGHNTKSLYNESVAKVQEKRVPINMPSKFSSLAEVRGCIYHIAKDQHGCRFLQRTFDEGTSQDVQIVFNEIIDHVVELMMNPFGNYLMQKLLEVCNEEQRMHILLRVTEARGDLVRICLNTHGTRVVQKLIETLKTRQQISLVISALEPGFLALIKDLNGNHVVQRCLQCFNSEDSKFIFIAAAKYCVDIATHQHGCCVLQRCISHATGVLREKLIDEISSNALLLAQDAFGNYVVQFILELKNPSASSKLTAQFEGNYVHLSRQKFSSHVVERCLELCNDGTRSKIIHEFLSAAYFEQLLQDPHANYVVQVALRVSEGRLHNSLVNAIESHKALSRNSPYSKRIFSQKLLKR